MGCITAPEKTWVFTESDGDELKITSESRTITLDNGDGDEITILKESLPKLYSWLVACFAPRPSIRISCPEKKLFTVTIWDDTLFKDIYVIARDIGLATKTAEQVHREKYPDRKNLCVTTVKVSACEKLSQVDILVIADDC